jgi:acyl-CoA-dependent ceramide synthase
LHLHNLENSQTHKRRPRKSSAFGSDIRAGDTGAPALASSRASLNAVDASAQSSRDAPSYAAVTNGKAKPSRRRKAGVFSSIRQAMVKHTFILPAFLLAVILLAYAVNPTPSNPLHHFIFLSYELPAEFNDAAGNTHYGKGPWDIAFVAFYTIVLSFTREFIMQEILRPLARKAGLNKSKQARFMEQVYTAVYFTFLGPFGMYVMKRTPVWYFDTVGMYENFPHRSHDAVFKFYYLFQAAYWAQQAIVLLLGMEKPRKDFKELVGHHIVTLALIALSYRFHFTYMGIAVFTTHDISDWFLATVKTLNYLDHFALAPFYGVFMCVWIYLRHFINLKIIWSLFTTFRTVGPFELNWETQQYKCWISQYITASLLIMLQTLNLFWLFYIVRIAYRMLAHNVAEDDRSDDEPDEEEETPAVADKAPAAAAIEKNQ